MAGPFDHTRSEIIAGGFVLAGLILLGYLSISIGGFSLLPEKRYQVSARFSDIGDLKPGAPVKLAGVTVGEVASIRLADYVAEVQLALDRTLQVPSDTIASVATAGLLGDAYLTLSPGGSDENLAAGGRITRTEPALNLADLLGRYAFGAAQEGAGKPAEPERPGGAPDAIPEQPTKETPR
jgi:phospholipid/cholesterol/gamma-HCH transport system substrate-binding protein